ncbi:MAG: NnrS family protein [Candidatus Omnitrophica bacterium]|nr:NnrS family protein [Candidatus Omnitrophota bacterium]
MNKFQEMANVICREPYRLFFPLGVGMGMVGISPWLIYAMGLSETYSGFFHSSMQMLVYMNCFIVGFLMTFIPRFTGTFYASKAEILSFLFIFMGMAIFLYRQEWATARILYLIWLVLLIVFVMRRVPHREKAGGKPPVELIWIPVAIFHAFVGTIILLLVGWQIIPGAMSKIGRPLMEQGFIIAIVLGIGGFLIPRTLGTYQKEEVAPGGCCGSCVSTAQKISPTIKALWFHGVCGFFLFMSFWFKGSEWSSVGYVLQGVVATGQFFWTRILPRYPRDVGFYGKLAWISCWMIVIGFWGAAFFPQYDAEMLHIAFIGGFSLMTFAIATMVILSHGGQAERLKKPLWVLWVVFVALVFTLLKRMSVIFFPEIYFKMLGMASIIWMAGAGAWLIFVLPKLFRVPHEDEFAKMHEQVKQRLNH